MPKVKIIVYQDVVAPGGVIDVYLGANVASTTYDIVLSSGTTGTITTNTNGFGSTQITVPTSVSGSLTASVTVGSTAYTDTFLASARGASLVQQLEDDVLSEFQEIKVHNEGVIEENLGNSIFKFAFKNWNKDVDPLFMLDGNVIHSISPWIDWDTGIVGVHGVDTQDLFANYAFRFFTQSNMYDYISNAVKELNLIKPFTQFVVDSAPVEWDPLLLMRASHWAYRKLLQSLIFRDNRLFTVQEGSQQIIQDVLSNIQTDWQAIRKDAKRRSMINPASIVSGRYRVPIRVTGENYRSYTGVVS